MQVPTLHPNKVALLNVGFPSTLFLKYSNYIHEKTPRINPKVCYSQLYWFSFQDFLPVMAKEYGFEYELVQYKWPRWLHQQTEKQRIIWGYKILFLDVLFPLHIKKIIFVDADQVQYVSQIQVLYYWFYLLSYYCNYFDCCQLLVFLILLKNKVK